MTTLLRDILRPSDFVITRIYDGYLQLVFDVRRRRWNYEGTRCDSFVRQFPTPANFA